MVAPSKLSNWLYREFCLTPHTPIKEIEKPLTPASTLLQKKHIFCQKKSFNNCF